MAKEKFYTVQEAVGILHYSERHFRALLADGELTGAYRLTPRGKWLIPERVLFRLKAEQPESEKDVRTSDTGVKRLIRELQRASVTVAGKRIDMARLFWMLSEFLLAGMEPASVFPTALAALSQGTAEERANAANFAARELMFKLRAFQLVQDETRQRGLRAYGVVACTPRGASVVQALMAKKWPRPQFEPTSEDNPQE